MKHLYPSRLVIWANTNQDGWETQPWLLSMKLLMVVTPNLELLEETKPLPIPTPTKWLCLLMICTSVEDHWFVSKPKVWIRTSFKNLTIVSSSKWVCPYCLSLHGRSFLCWSCHGSPQRQTKRSIPSQNDQLWLWNSQWLEPTNFEEWCCLDQVAKCCWHQ